MAEKVTIMKLKVDLQCAKCYKKVKKILCKFPQIRDEVYDEKNNIVTITVVCCSPEKIRDKLCYKGCGTIKTIEIVEPPKSKTPEKPKPEKFNESQKPNEHRKEPENPKPETKVPTEKPPPPAPESKPEAPKGDLPPVPIGMCCMECYEGREGGPCFDGYGGPISYYGRPVCDQYPICEEDNTQQACTIM